MVSLDALLTRFLAIGGRTRLEFRDNLRKPASCNVFAATTRMSHVASNDQQEQQQLEIPRQTKTFYRRALPNTCVSFSSSQGKSHFKSSMQHSGLRCFYHLIEQYSTQAEPAYCGLSTLTIALNSLAVDPRKTWKGPWRWYEETMLNCCYDLESVKKTGITLPMFTGLASCQGVETELHHAENVTLEKFRGTLKQVCVEPEEGQPESRNTDSIDQVLIVSYDRKTLGQTGSGHFSPVAAYDPSSDSALILDTARFKYGAHWIPVPLLFQAMLPRDPDTSKSRGYVVIHSQQQNFEAHLPMPMLLKSEMKQNVTRREFKKYIQEFGTGLVYDDVVQFFQENGSVWTITKPQIKPLEEESAIVNEVRLLILQLMPTVSDYSETACADANCLPAQCRTVRVTQKEAMYIVWLACQSQEKRSQIVLQAESVVERAKQQLLAEAELVWYAIEFSEQE